MRNRRRRLESEQHSPVPFNCPEIQSFASQTAHVIVRVVVGGGGGGEEYPRFLASRSLLSPFRADLAKVPNHDLV